MPTYREHQCDKHGATRAVLEGSGYFRCVNCRSEAVTRSRKRTKLKLVEMFGGKCRICNYSKTPHALEFHHIDPTTKEFGLGEKGLCRAFEKLVEEAKKCVLLCANCHREVEAGVTQLPTAI